MNQKISGSFPELYSENMKIFQQKLQLRPFPRGFHVITEQVLQAIPQIREIEAGQLQVFIQHTSASLTINENADPSVRHDFEAHFNKMVPEEQPYYRHTQEGADDMPAHIKSSLLGASVHIPVSKGQLALGTWQGIYLCEHRDNGGARTMVLTLWGL